MPKTPRTTFEGEIRSEPVCPGAPVRRRATVADMIDYPPHVTNLGTPEYRFVAYVDVNPVFSPRGNKMVLSNPTAQRAVAFARAHSDFGAYYDERRYSREYLLDGNMVPLGGWSGRLLRALHMECVYVVSRSEVFASEPRTGFDWLELLEVYMKLVDGGHFGNPERLRHCSGIYVENEIQYWNQRPSQYFPRALFRFEPESDDSTNDGVIFL